MIPLFTEGVKEPMGMEQGKPTIKRWSNALIILSGFAVVICICAMLVVHHRIHSKAEASVSNRMIEDAERLVSILDYHYARCRREVGALAGSLSSTRTDRQTDSSGSTGPEEGVNNEQRHLITYLLHQPHYDRIAIVNAAGETLYDSRPSKAADPPPRFDDTVLPTASQATIHTDEHNILVTAAIEPGSSPTGLITAWIDGKAILRHMANSALEPGIFYSLMDHTGRIVVPETLPEGFRFSASNPLSALTDGTLSTVNAAPDQGPNGAMDFQVIVLPIPRTPLKLLSVNATSGSGGSHHAWHYAIIAAALSLTLLFFFLVQQRINSKNNKLMVRYTNAQQQYKIMVQNNEDLANEVLLRKRAEAELKIINEYLEEIVTHRTRKLKATLEDLQATQSQLIQSGKLASIGELAAGIAHELNQPLMVIRGNAQLMSRKQKKAKLDTDQMLSFFDTIERNTKRMILIINHLRSFSRQSTRDFQSVDINQVINDAFLMIGEQMRLRNIQTIKNLSHDLPYVKGDPYQLEQVFLNLLTNARDAIEIHHSDEDAYRCKKEITITTRLKNGGSNMVEILFKDTGCGIEAQDMDKIFDPFFTTKEVGKGTGLGLSISYGILQEHGGHLEFVDTTPGNTTLIVVLPAQ